MGRKRHRETKIHPPSTKEVANMCKKLAIFLVAILAGVVLLQRTQFGTFLRVKWSDFRAEAKDKVDPETRIKMLEEKIRDINPELRKAADTLIKQEVQRDRDRASVEALCQKVADERKNLEVLVEGLESNSAFVTVQGQKYNAEEAQRRLDRERKQYESDRNILKSREESLKVQEEGLKVLDERIQAMSARKKEFEALVGTLKVRVEQYKLKKLENKVTIDDSAFSDCEELARDLDTWLKEADLQKEVYQRYGITKNEKAPVTEKVSREESIKAAKAALQAEAAGQK